MVPGMCLLLCATSCRRAALVALPGLGLARDNFIFLGDHVLTQLPPNSRQAIKKYVSSNNKINVASQATFDAQFNKAIKAGVEKGEFTQPKGKLSIDPG